MGSSQRGRPWLPAPYWPAQHFPPFLLGLLGPNGRITGPPFPQPISSTINKKGWRRGNRDTNAT